MPENDPRPEPELVITELSKGELLEQFNDLLDERDSALSRLAITAADHKAAKEEVAAIEAKVFEKAREIRHGVTPLPLLDAHD